MEVREVDDVVQLKEAVDQTPMLTRVVNYEPFSHIHPKLKSFPINELPNNRTQEALIMYDLLNVMQGFGGIYIRFNKEYDPYSNEIPQFRLVRKMDSSLKSFCSKIVNLGKYYTVLLKASEKWSDENYGIVLQRLGFEFRKYLNDVYLKFVVNNLEKEFLQNSRFSIREFKQIVNNSEINKQMAILFDFYLRIEAEMDMRSKIDPDRVKLTNLLAELQNSNTDNNSNNGNHNDIQNNQNQRNDTEEKYSIFIDGDYFPVAKGGVILNILSSMISENFGDRNATIFMKQLLISISEKYCIVLHEWMTQGILNDPYDEFMINDTMKNFKGSISNPIEYERLWLTQYCVRKDGLLTRFSNDKNNQLLFKIIMTGKLLNLVRNSLQIMILPISENLMGNEIMTIIDLLEGTKLELYVDKWYNRANELAIKLFFDNYKLRDILIFLQRNFFGYSNGNFFTKLLNKNFSELTKKRVFNNNNSSENKLEQFLEHEKQLSYKNDIIMKLFSLKFDNYSFKENILNFNKISNDFNENFNELISDQNRNDRGFSNFTNNLIKESTQKTRPIQDIKSNIHYLKFDVAIPYPINVIINRINITQYQNISQYFNLLKYHSCLMDEIWIEINKNKIWRYNGYSDEIYRKIITRSRVIHNKMNNFIKCINEYITQDIIDNEMKQILNGKFNNIIDLQTLLEVKLSDIMGNYCLVDLMEIQLQIFDIIQIFCKFITSMRLKLCQIDYNLYEKYVKSSSSSMRTTTKHIIPYDEDESILKNHELQKFLLTIQTGFDQHFVAFCDGLVHVPSDRAGNTGNPGERLLRALLGRADPHTASARETDRSK